MSTRCQIIVEGADVVLYRHSDGYPDGVHGVLKALKASVSRFMKYRGFDECYMPAHIIADMIASHKAWADKCIRREKRKDKSYNTSSYESCKYLGYGIEGYNPNHGADDNAFHGDIAFLYVVKKNGTIEVRTPNFHFGSEAACSIHNTEVVKTVKIEPRKRKAKVS